MKVVICGGGNLAHAFVGELGNNPYIDELSIVTRKPTKWQKNISVYYNHTFNHKVTLTNITDSFEILKDTDLIILTLPTNIKLSYINKIKNYVSLNTILITAPSIGGINFAFEKDFPCNKYICFQRVPYICRTIQYGSSVNTEVKKEVEVYFSKNSNQETRKILQKILNLPFKELASYWTLSLSNSNPILHIAGICEILKQNYPYTYLPKLYDVWSDYASELSLGMDNELATITEKLKISDYHSLYNHYQVKNSQDLTQKLKSIKSFKDVLAPLQKINDKFYIDKTSRYIVEDLPYGTCFIKYIASILNIETPNIDFAIRQVQPFMDIEFVSSDGKFNIENWKKVTHFKFDKVIRDELGI